jgi:hypothetical protein
MKRQLIFFLVLVNLNLIAQIGPRSWQDHIGNRNCNSVTYFNDKIYASNYSGILISDITFDNVINNKEITTDKLNKINGLSDVGIKLLRANPDRTKLMVFYENSNIDIIDLGNNVVNYPYLKLKIVNGKKTINNVTFNGNLAYISCGFGIVVFDLNKLEVRDTYFISSGSIGTEVFQSAVNDSLIYAATVKGLYKINYKLKSPNNFNNWQRISFPNNSVSEPCGSVVFCGGKVYATYNPWKTNSNQLLKDTLYEFQIQTGWQKVNAGYPATFFKIPHVDSKIFSLVDQFGVRFIRASDNSLRDYITSFNGKVIQIADLYYNIGSENSQEYFLLDQLNGFIYTNGPSPFFKQYLVSVEGSSSTSIGNIDVFDGKIGIAPSNPNKGGGSPFLDFPIDIYDGEKWTHIQSKDKDGNRIVDFTNVYFDRKDKTKLYASSWFNGIFEYTNQSITKTFNKSTFPNFEEVYPNASRCSEVKFDKAGNMWHVNNSINAFLGVYTTNGIYQTFNFPSPKYARRFIIDKNGFLWVAHEDNGGITVYNPGTNFNQPILNNTYVTLTKDEGNGNLGTNEVHCIVEDKDDKIWVGTGAGVRVFYNSANIFSPNSRDGQPIKIIQDGNVELLLDKEVVRKICIDGANNKWIGTERSGVYCFSPDGLKELHHFTAENSPLYSNEVVDINYDEKTGDVYIGTLYGLQSYRSTILQGEEFLSQVVAFPNPVRPSYQGSVLVKGLIDNCIVKICDESGNLVWETKSQGGQIEWPVKTFSGQRASNGVYIIYATSVAGDQKAVSKVLVIN